MATKKKRAKPKQKDPARDERGRIKPGYSGNPKGRPPKGHSITDMIMMMMGENAELKKAVATKIMQLALEGDVGAIKMLWSYMDGMPTQTTKLQVEQKPIPILGGESVVSTDDGNKKALPAKVED